MSNILIRLYNQLKRIARNTNAVDTKRFKNVVLYPPFNIVNSSINEFTYISHNSIVHSSSIGKYCSIGPNCVIGYGDHPTNFKSTSPIFYHTGKIFEFSYADTDLFNHSKKIIIGNDVWIGANVVIRNGITIGDGVIIGAGSVVVANLKPFGIYAGVPAKLIRMRFENEKVNNILSDPWWNWSREKIVDNLKDFQYPL